MPGPAIHTNAAGAIRPFYMWAGGKGRLVKEYLEWWPDMADYDHYVEPFFGGGAIFCWMNNEYGHLSGSVGEINAELVGVLREVRGHPKRFILRAQKLAAEFLAVDNHEDRKKWYYEHRALYWKSPDPATLYVLMRLGFNGIWQTCRDSKGLFGTPAGLLGQTSSVQVIDPTLIRNWSNALADVAIHGGSYEKIPLDSKGRSLIYLDPPYRQSFTSYGTGFSDADQEKLIVWFKEQAGAGHKVLLANRDDVGDGFFEQRLSDVADLHWFDVTYTAGRRKKIEGGYAAKKAREFLAISR